MNSFKVCDNPQKYEQILIDTLRKENPDMSEEELSKLESSIHRIMSTSKTEK